MPSDAERVARGLRAAWRHMAARVDGGSTHVFDGILVTLTNLPDDSLNVAFVEEAPGDPERALGNVEAWFARHGRALGLDMQVGRHAAVEAAAARLGLRPLVSRPAMARALDGMAARDLPPGVLIRPVTDRADLSLVLDIQVGTFHIARDVCESFIPPSVLGSATFRLYLALVDGEPVGCASGHVEGGTVGVFGVATAPAWRGRGIGTAVTWRVLEDARPEADLAWLQATTMGKPVYSRMGFREVGEWTVWTRPYGTR